MYINYINALTRSLHYYVYKDIQPTNSHQAAYWILIDIEAGSPLMLTRIK